MQTILFSETKCNATKIVATVHSLSTRRQRSWQQKINCGEIMAVYHTIGQLLIFNCDLYNLYQTVKGRTFHCYLYTRLNAWATCDVPSKCDWQLPMPERGGRQGNGMVLNWWVAMTVWGDKMYTRKRPFFINCNVRTLLLCIIASDMSLWCCSIQQFI